MRETDRGRLEHMYDAARFAYGYARERGRRDFDQDLTLALAVVKLIEIIGEAASRVSADGRAALPEIGWDDIIGMRHRLIHAYYDSTETSCGRPPLRTSRRSFVSLSARLVASRKTESREPPNPPSAACGLRLAA